MDMTFVDARHEQLYHEARAMLDAELARQASEAARLSNEGKWDFLPAPERQQKYIWLQRHFAECRKPYEKILTDILALCPRIMIVDKNERLLDIA